MWVTSDWHLGHKRIARFRNNIKSMEENTSLLISNYNEVICKRDVVWFLGDIAFNKESLEEIDKLKGDKRLILGNHDTHKHLTISDLSTVFNEIHSLISYKDAWLSHCPIHPDELRGKINIHGHTHNHIINDNRYINVCVDQTNMYPVIYQEIIRKLKYEN